MFFAQCVSDFSLAYGLPLSLFLAGLVGGFTHCSGMCSPFVFAQVDHVSQKGGETKGARFLSMALLPYHLGRMTTYVGLAVVVSSVVNLAFISSELRVLITAPMLMLAGVLFLVSAFPALLSVFPWAGRLRFGLPEGVVSKVSAAGFKVAKTPTLLRQYMTGVLLGFLPCGLVVSALLAAATAGHVVSAGAAMAAFAVGTMPALVLVGFGGAALRAKYPKASKHLTQGAMLVSCGSLFFLAGSMIFK
ncbi:MAG: sulfite exporter TauE/SafE family protein [Alphaproteobacteria bacterium]